VSRHGTDTAAAVLAEAAKGYGAIVLGLTDRLGGPLSPMVESILAESTRPVVMIRAERISGKPLPAAFARALVPVTGSVNSRAAQELAFALAASLGTELVLAHLDSTPALLGHDVVTRMVEVAEPLLRHATDTARLSGAGRVTTLSRTADSIPGEINRLTVEYDADLVIVGTTPRRTGGSVHLGPVVGHLLDACAATVVVVATPSGWIGHQG
jgi:nucleotide-binding universal stress UspA family protein